MEQSPKETKSGLEIVKNIFASITSALGPFATVGRLDYLEPESRAHLSPSDRVKIDADLNSIYTN